MTRPFLSNNWMLRARVRFKLCFSENLGHDGYLEIFQVGKIQPTVNKIDHLINFLRNINGLWSNHSRISYEK